MRRYPFVTVDVFTSRALSGNGLAVFTDAAGLSDAEMQALAREMNLSETTFVLARDAAVERERGVSVRIFTIGYELPFAGHPTLGTAYVLARMRQRRDIVLDLKVGRIPIRFTDREGEMFGEMTQRDPEFGFVHNATEVAAVTGLPPGAIDASLPIQTVSTGVAFAIVPIISLASFAELHVDQVRILPYLERTATHQFYFVSRETRDPAARLHARMQFIGGEDPATGSAAGDAAAWMVRNGIAHPGEQVLIEQGIEVQRPSRIFVRASLDGSRVHDVRVGGHVVEVIRGEVSLP
ncbi:MAG: PhzF family phenazine biosynthesis protein [Candidatus Binataceae bacterium]